MKSKPESTAMRRSSVILVKDVSVLGGWNHTYRLLLVRWEWR